MTGDRTPTAPDTEPRETGCRFGCGYISSGDDLEDHERYEHTTCERCGGEPDPPHPVNHAADCERVSEATDWEHIASVLGAVVKRAQHPDPEEFEPHA